MGQYAEGRVSVTQGSDQVVAAWQAVVLGAGPGLKARGLLLFQTGGAEGRTFAHDGALAELTFGLDVGPDPILGEQAIGPSITQATAGLADAGGVDTLQDVGAGWAVDQHAGRFVFLRPGTATEECARIVSNTADTLTVDRNWTVAPGGGDAFEIYTSQTVTVSSFRSGTPADFVAAGVVPGDRFTRRGSNIEYAIQGVAARVLTLAAVYAGSSENGVPYSVQRDFSTNHGWPLPQSQGVDQSFVAQLAISGADRDLWLGAPTALGLGSGWAQAASAPAAPLYRLQTAGPGGSLYRIVRLVGAVDNAAPGAGRTHFATLPVGARPPAGGVRFATPCKQGGSIVLAFVEIFDNGEAWIDLPAAAATVDLSLDPVVYFAVN